MMTAPKAPQGVEASPPIAANTVDEWENQKSDLFRTLQHEIYGIMPTSRGVKKTKSRSVNSEGYSAVVEEIELTASYFVNEGNQAHKDASAETEIKFDVVLVLPEARQTRIPVIMMANFCPNNDVIPLSEISKPQHSSFTCHGGNLRRTLISIFFGRYIISPPIQTILDQGYGIAVVFPSDTFPDKASQLDRYEAAPNTDIRWGAIGAWAWQTSLLSNYLDQDGRFSHTIAYGHSRYGKSVLLAAAYDDSIDGVIAHQSGTGGASLSKNKPGETVASITKQYPHWFTPAYAEENLSIDQHHLMSLIAPRPVLLGNAKRDVWSDPEGAFRAARGATPIYKLYGSDGLEQEKLNQFNPNADIAFWLRNGTHGVVKEDWPAFLWFLNAHFK